MGKKIILFLSTLKDTAKESEYDCPDNIIVTGRQTNEAPVKYLLKTNSDIEEIICFTTKSAEESAWSHFSDSVRTVNKSVKLTKIDFEEDDDGYNFEKKILPEVLNAVGEKDEIILEITGGFRDAVMYLMLLSRALSYAGIKIVDATYSKINTGENNLNKVTSVVEMIDIFELINGMQELTSFGNVKTLSKYYSKNKSDDKIENLINSVKGLFEAITLCRTKQIKVKMDEFNKALRSAEESSDPLFRSLVPAFKKTFGKDKKLSTHKLIEWCIERDMVQQALTVYTERIPAYIMDKSNGIFKKVPEENIEKQDYEDQDCVNFYRGFLMLGNELPGSKSGLITKFSEFCRNKSSSIFDYHKGKIDGNFIPDELKNAVYNICIIATYAYDNDVYDESWVKEIPENKKYLADERFCKNEGQSAIKNAEKFINSIASKTNDLKCKLLEIECIGDEDFDKSENTYVNTIKNMEYLVENSNYELKCSVDTMKAVCTDYMYIKSIRNMTNHANDKTTQNEKLIEYFLETKYDGVNYYPDLNEIQVEDIKNIVLHALDVLKMKNEK